MDFSMGCIFLKYTFTPLDAAKSFKVGLEKEDREASGNKNDVNINVQIKQEVIITSLKPSS